MTEPERKARVAFLGLGVMGSGMAHRLLNAGFPLTVFNRSLERAQGLATQGASVAGSPYDAAARAEVIISMVADDDASRQIWLGDAGALAASGPGTVCVECSTLSVGWVQELAAAASSKRCQCLDAPVTGSKTHARSGELTFMVGGNAATVEQVLPLFRVMGKTIHRVGPQGSGALLKLINNFVCGVQIAAFAEAAGMVERGGLERDKALEILLSGALASPLIKTVAERVAAQEAAPHFLLRLMAKDLRYAIEEGRKVSLELTTATAALKRFEDGIAAGDGDRDISALVKGFLRR